MVIATLCVADVGEQLDRIEQVVVCHAVGVVAEEHFRFLARVHPPCDDRGGDHEKGDEDRVEGSGPGIAGGGVKEDQGGDRAADRGTHRSGRRLGNRRNSPR